MGMTRKMLSVSTLGLVDFRSDKERAAAYARGTRKHTREMAKQAKEQTKLMAKQARTKRQAIQAFTTVGPEERIAGWFIDMSDESMLRWWDGDHWTDTVRKR